jgi:asparagine synthase (glutamine-hydrolysing)
MCGIVGVIVKQESANKYFDSLGLAVDTLKERGPNHQGEFKDERCGLGHARLSIIDITEGASQPFYSADKRYVLVFIWNIFWERFKFGFL